MADYSGTSTHDAADTVRIASSAAEVDHAHLLASAIGKPADITNGGGMIKTNVSDCNMPNITECSLNTVDGTLVYRGKNMVGITTLQPDSTIAAKSPDEAWNQAVKNLGAFPRTEKFIAAYPELRDITKVKQGEWATIFGRHDLSAAESKVMQADSTVIQSLSAKALLPDLNDHSFKGDIAVLNDKLLRDIRTYADYTTLLGDPKTEPTVRNILDQTAAAVQKELDVRQGSSADHLDAHSVLAPVDKAYEANQQAFKDAPHYKEREQAARKSYATMAGQLGNIANTALVYNGNSMTVDQRIFATRVVDTYERIKRDYSRD